MDPIVQVPKVDLQVLAVVLPRHLVHPGGGLRVHRPVGHPQAVDVDVVHQRGEPCLLVLLCCSTHTVQRIGRAVPGSVSGARFAGRVPLGQPPFLTVSAAGIPALFDGFAGTTGLSDFPRSFISGVTPWRSLSGPPPDHSDGQAWDLPVLAHGGSEHAQVLRPRGVR